MADTSKEMKPSFIKGVKSEFNKIIWPNKDTLLKQTAAVLSISVALGVIIGLIDLLFKYGFGLIIK